VLENSVVLDEASIFILGFSFGTGFVVGFLCSVRASVCDGGSDEVKGYAR